MANAKIHHLAQVNGSERIDHYMAKSELATSRSVAGKWLAEARVHINGVVAKPSTHVRDGDEIVIQKPTLQMSGLKPIDMPLHVLFEDKDLIVLDKPAGLVVHPGAGHHDISLVHGLLAHCQDLSGVGGMERPGIVHRLDKGTTGVMVVAKNDRAHHALTEQFKERQIEKHYLAVVIGCFAQKRFTIDNLMKRSEINRKKFVVNAKKGKQAITDIVILQSSSRATCVEAIPHTGRTHQIRVHLHHVGHPILGDETYGGVKNLDAFNDEEKKYIRELGRPMLHAERLSFTHPRTKKRLEFKAKVPQDMQDVMRRFIKDTR